MDYLISIIQQLGIIGLLIAMLLEGSSLPFPGIVVVLSFGFALQPSMSEIFLFSIAMSLIYSLASFIPYFLGSKSETFIRNKFENKLDKAQAFFHRYGAWSISLSRPFTVGNYISYVAGISKVSKFKYFIHTFLGILPWSIVTLTLGKMGAKFNFDSLLAIMGKWWIPIVIGIVVILLFIIIQKKRKRRTQNFQVELETKRGALKNE